jgi:hypothetical protein
MLTWEQLQIDVDYLVRRAKRAGGFYADSNRDWGMSSNSLVNYAYDVGVPVMPSDWHDYAACVRAARNLPRHRRTQRVLTALSVQKSAVLSRYPNRHGRSQRESVPKDLVST